MIVDLYVCIYIYMDTHMYSYIGIIYIYTTYASIYTYICISLSIYFSSINASV